MAEADMDDGGSGESGYLGGLITGLLLGAAAALLLAPKPGGEFRHDLAEGASKLKDKAGSLGGTVSDTARELKARGEDVVSDVRALGEDVRAAGEEPLADAADYAQAMTEDNTDGARNGAENV